MNEICHPQWMLRKYCLNYQRLMPGWVYRSDQSNITIVHSWTLFEEVFSKMHKVKSKNICCGATAKFKDHVSEKNFLSIYIYIYIYTCIRMWKAIYPNTIIILGISIASSFSGMVLHAFWKGSFHLLSQKCIPLDTSLFNAGIIVYYWSYVLVSSMY